MQDSKSDKNDISEIWFDHYKDAIAHCWKSHNEILSVEIVADTKGRKHYIVEH